MADQMTEEEIAEYQLAFNLFDKEGDGLITRKELTKLMRSLGLNPTDSEMQDMTKSVQGEKPAGDSVDFLGFLDLISVLTKNSTGDQELHEAFKMFDRSGNGVISAEELRSVMTNVGESLTDSEVDEMIRQVDTDGTGTISYEEFKAVIMK